MALICTKCLIGTVGSGGGLLPPDAERFRLELSFTPDGDGAVEGDRSVLFEGEVVDGNPEVGVSARGTLMGNFGLSAEENIEAAAHVETFTRNGTLALVTVAVRGESGRATFAATLTPQVLDAPPTEMVFDADVFMGRPEGFDG